MSILKPFIWMFETENFGKRIMQLLRVLILFFILTYICYFTSGMVQFNNFQKLLLCVAACVFYSFGWLIIQGYFWELTAKVISRDMDIEANNVYSGKIKSIYTVHLPEFKPMTFLWRGIASVVASIIMVLPYAMLVYSTMFTESFLMPWDNIQSYHHIYFVSYNLLYLAFFAFMPAMLWNYAKQNSVFAVWNIPKAVYLLENYFFRYVGHTILFVLFYILNCVILYWVYQTFGNTAAYIVSAILYLYSLHVYAYLLGTITPVAEG